jgi:hypothetical protein
MRKSKIITELCEKLQVAKIGEVVSMMASNNKLYCYKMREYLESIGYKYGIDFEYPNHSHLFIKKLSNMEV